MPTVLSRHIGECARKPLTVKEICEQAQELCRRVESVGDRDLRAEVVSQARRWVLDVEAQVDAMSAGDALVVMSLYDEMHQLAYGRRPRSGVVDRYVFNALDASLRGDKTVDQYTLFRMIEQGIRRRDEAYYGKALRWQSRALDEWHRQFQTGVSDSPMSDYDLAQRVTLLLDSDLWVFETTNEPRYKQRLLATYRHLLPEYTYFHTKSTL